MIKVEILRDTVVRVSKGDVVEVSDTEAKRLAAFGNAKPVAGEAKKDAKPKTVKKAK